jgi:hypothetical protein
LSKSNPIGIAKEAGSKAGRQKMRKIGLDRQDAITIFRRTFADKAVDDPLVNSIAKAVGEIIEENNKKLLDDLAGSSEEGGK